MEIQLAFCFLVKKTDTCPEAEADKIPNCLKSTETPGSLNTTYFHIYDQRMGIKMMGTMEI